MTKKVLTFLLSCCVSVGIAEVVLHALRPAVAYQHMPQRVIAEFYDSSALTEFTLKRSYEGRHTMTAAAFDSTIKTNSLGWRDSEPDGRKQVLVFGDSFVFGYGLNNSETIPARLEEQSGSTVDFVNLGFTAGAAPDGYANYLRHTPRLHGKDAIAIVYTNDLADLKRTVCLDKNGVRVAIGSDDCVRVKGPNSFVRGGMLFHQRSWISQNLPMSLRTLLKRSYVLALARDRLSSGDHPEVVAVRDSARASSDGATEAAIKKLRASLNILNEMSKSLIVFTLANREEFELSPPDSAWYNHVRDHCNRSGIPYFHIPGFSKKYYWQRDGHFNPLGAKKAADIIYRHLDVS